MSTARSIARIACALLSGGFALAQDVVFSKQPIDPAKPANLTTTFQAGDPIYALMRFPKPIREHYRNQFMVQLELDGNVVFYQYLSLKDDKALNASHDDLDPAPPLAGTAGYMAPEQIRGEPVDARADLYALGCILHELLTGATPFPGSAAREVLRRHLQDPVPDVTAAQPGLPAALAELIASLLAKHAADRPGHAGVVAAALGRLGARSAGDGPPARDYLYRAPLSGRSDAVAWIEELLATLGQGRGGLALLFGESGIGKTRLLMEAVRRAGARGIRTLLTTAAPGAGSLALFGPIFRAVVDRCLERGPEETQILLGRSLPVLVPHAPELMALPGASVVQVPDLPPAEAERQIVTAVRRVLDAFARSEPLLLILDDLQWADGLSLFVLRSLGEEREEGDPAVLALGAYRSDEAGEDLRALASAPGTAASRLGRLGEADIGAIVSAMLAVRTPGPAFVSHIARHSEGNPFFVGEYLRAAAAERLLCRDARGRWSLVEEGASIDALPLPTTLREVVQRRLDGLSPRALDLALHASVLGRDLDPELLARVAGAPEPRLLATLSELVARQVLEEKDAGALSFAHENLREVAYSTLGTRKRRRLHTKAADALSAQGAEGTRRGLRQLARHLEGAGRLAAARDRYRDAAEQARAAHALSEAAESYGAWLRLTSPRGAERVDARLALADVLFLSGRALEAERHLLPARGGARLLGDVRREARALMGLASVRGHLGRPRHAMAAARRACELGSTIGDEPLTALAMANMGGFAYEQGRLDEASRWLEEAITLFRRTGQRAYEARTLGTLGNVRGDRGRLDEALPLHEAALAIHRELGNRRYEGITLGNIAIAHQERGEMAEARACYEAALAIHREVEDRPDQGLTLMNLATVETAEGRLTQAREMLEQAIAIHREVGARRHEGAALWNLARAVRLDAGLPQEVAPLLERAEAALLEAGDRYELCQCLCERGHLALLRGEDATPSLRKALAMGRELGAGPGSLAGQAIARLDRAVAARLRGEQLWRGDARLAQASDET